MNEMPNGAEPFLTTLNHAAADPFRLLVEAVKDYGIFMLDPNGSVFSWNSGAAKIKGYSAAEIIGQHFSCFYTEEDIAAGKPEHGLKIALAEGRFEEEGLRLRKGGSSFWAIVTITDIRDELGQHIGFANVMRDITELRRAERMLRLHERTIESLVQGLCITDPTLPDNPIVFVNNSFLRITGYSREESIGRNCRFLQGPKTPWEATEQIRAAIRENQSCLVELLNYRKDGTTFWNGLSISPIRDVAGEVAHFVGVLTDISPSKLMAEQFYQAQKMEAVGQLAGGVAHDFNNLLTIISGYSALLLEMLSSNDPKREAVKAISEAGERAAGLTRQLLSFSRKAVLDTKIIEPNQIVIETEKLLRRMIGEDILLTAVLDPSIDRIKIDPGQMGQILMNLAVNARDAMPKGGKLTIETKNIAFDGEQFAPPSDCKVGRHVMMAISDNGCGMTPEVQAHVFEPFFTTKGPGKGSGLGLATVYGIVKQSGGCIELSSETGLGTTFKIFFPAVEAPVTANASDRHAVKVMGGDETILLVEDEDAVRAIAMLALQTQGYDVLHAESGKQALHLVEKLRAKIDLLVTDVVMPGISGRELAGSLSLQFANLKLLYVSGYTDDSVIRHGISHEEVEFLQKPYTPLALARKVREVLDKQ